MPPFINKRIYSDLPSDYRNYAIELRGHILNDVAEMEREIDDYICRYFCSITKKRNELMEVIIATKHLTFSAKADILRCILERRKDATKSEATKIWRHLMETIAPQRNMIAHYSLDNSGMAITNFQTDSKKTIYFLKYANTKSSESFTKKDTMDLSELIFGVKQYVWGLKAMRYQKRRKK